MNNEQSVERLKNFILKVAGKQLDKAITNAVIEGTVIKVNENNSTYTVQPRNSDAAAAITATPLNNATYQVNDLVYMISYEGDLSTVYHIFGSVMAVAEDFVNLSLEDRFEVDLQTWWDNEDGALLDKLISDIDKIKQESCFKIEGRFKTVEGIAQESNYGLRVDLLSSDNYSEDNIINTYYLNPSYFLGQPYNLDGSITQSRIVTLTKDEADKLKAIKVSTFGENFEYSDLKLSCGILLNIEGTLNVLTTIENDKDYVSSRNLNDKAVVSVKVNYDGRELSSTLLSYYWLLKDENVKTETDVGYLAAAGAGWRCLNLYEKVSILGLSKPVKLWKDESRTFEFSFDGVDTDKPPQLPHYENTLKCLVKFEDLTAESREFTIYNYDKEQFSATLTSNVNPASIISKKDFVELTCKLKNENKKWSEDDRSYSYTYTWYKDDGVNITPKKNDGTDSNLSALIVYGAEPEKTESETEETQSKTETNYYVMTSEKEKIYCKVVIKRNSETVSLGEITNEVNVTSYIGQEATIKQETYYKYYISTNMSVGFVEEQKEPEEEGGETTWSGDWVIVDSPVSGEDPRWIDEKGGEELKGNDGYDIVFKDMSIVDYTPGVELIKDAAPYLIEGVVSTFTITYTIRYDASKINQLGVTLQEYNQQAFESLAITNFSQFNNEVSVTFTAIRGYSFEPLDFVIKISYEINNIADIDDLYVYYTQRDVWTQEKMGESELIKEENWATPLIARGLDYDATQGGWYNAKEGAAAAQINTFNQLTNNGTLQGIHFDGNDAYINATYINTGELRVGNENEEVFYANVDTEDVKIGGFYVGKNSIHSKNGSINISSDNSDNSNLAIAVGGSWPKFTIQDASELQLFYKIDESGESPVYGAEEADGNILNIGFQDANVPIITFTYENPQDPQEKVDTYIYNGNYEYQSTTYDRWDGIGQQEGRFILTNIIIENSPEKFSVNHGGQLKASDADIKGHITATSLTVSPGAVDKLSDLSENMGVIEAGIIQSLGYEEKEIWNEAIKPSESQGLTYSYYQGKYMVTGIGNCQDTEIIIPNSYNNSSVIRIAPKAFQFNTNITKVILPDTVTTIGESAFEKCLALTEVVLSNNLRRIEKTAFYNSHITKISIPDSVSTLEEGAFNDCNYLKEVILGKNIQTIERVAFGTCDRLSKILIPDGVTVLGEQMFAGCGQLFEVILPKSIISLGNAVFGSCVNLQNVYYEGTYDFFQNISLDPTNNTDLMEHILYYSKEQPISDTKRYWHYKDGFRISCEDTMITSPNFKVSLDGKIKAVDASLSGAIEAESGFIGEFKIEDGVVFNGDENVKDFFNKDRDAKGVCLSSNGLNIGKGQIFLHSGIDLNRQGIEIGDYYLDYGTGLNLFKDGLRFKYTNANSSLVQGIEFSNNDKKFHLQGFRDDTHPVGSIYMAAPIPIAWDEKDQPTAYEEPVPPASLFGGTWEQIEDVFLLGAGGRSAGTKGGSSTIKRANLPANITGNIAFNSGSGTRGAIYWADGVFTVSSTAIDAGYPSGSYAGGDKGYSQVNFNLGGSSESYLPPYLAVYIWQRIA